MLYDSVCSSLATMTKQCTFVTQPMPMSVSRWVTITLPFYVHIKHSQENLKNKTKKLMRDDVQRPGDLNIYYKLLPLHWRKTNSMLLWLQPVYCCYPCVVFSAPCEWLLKSLSKLYKSVVLTHMHKWPSRQWTGNKILVFNLHFCWKLVESDLSPNIISKYLFVIGLTRWVRLKHPPSTPCANLSGNSSAKFSVFHSKLLKNERAQGKLTQRNSYKKTDGQIDRLSGRQWWCEWVRSV